MCIDLYYGHQYAGVTLVTHLPLSWQDNFSFSFSQKITESLTVIALSVRICNKHIRRLKEIINMVPLLLSQGDRKSKNVLHVYFSVTFCL